MANTAATLLEHKTVSDICLQKNMLENLKLEERCKIVSQFIETNIKSFGMLQEAKNKAETTRLSS